MFKNLFNTQTKFGDFGLFLLRSVAGIIFFIHGLQKLNQIGIDNFSSFLSNLGVFAPQFFAYVVIFVELMGGLFMIFGLFAKIFALLSVIHMFFAMYLVHFSKGFYVSQGGYEFVLLLMFVFIYIFLYGPGKYSLDYFIGSKLKSSN